MQELCNRMADHRSGYNIYKRGSARYVCVYSMFDEYGIGNMKIGLVEAQGYHIQDEDFIHKRLAGRTLKECV